MRALTLHQPWASNIVYGGKDVENRTWTRAYRGPVMIHAGQGRDRTAMANSPDDLPRKDVHGAVIGVALLIGTHHRCDGRCSPRWADPGCWHWEMSAPQPLIQPVPARGQQQLWVPDAPLCDRVRLQLPVNVFEGWRSW
ncbi:ASCH domain-containing protein [Streptomyces aculeolatus]